VIVRQVSPASVMSSSRSSFSRTFMSVPQLFHLLTYYVSPVPLLCCVHAYAVRVASAAWLVVGHAIIPMRMSLGNSSLRCE